MAIGFGMACPKPARTPRKARTRIRPTRKPLSERRQIDTVRAACVERDNCIGNVFYCSVFRIGMNDISPLEFLTECSGLPEWAHMHSRRRSKTRGMAPEVRHDSAHSLMLCQFHHGEYDAKRLIITALTRKGADGPLRFRRAKS